jgi:hypothetical protein
MCRWLVSQLFFFVTVNADTIYSFSVLPTVPPIFRVRSPSSWGLVHAGKSRLPILGRSGTASQLSRAVLPNIQAHPRYIGAYIRTLGQLSIRGIYCFKHTPAYS